MSFQPPAPLYSCFRLSMVEEQSSVCKHWQAHISRDDHGEWIGWSSHGEGDHPKNGESPIAHDSDIWTVVEALNERMDGRCHRGYQTQNDDDVAWIGEDLVDVLASQGVSIESPPQVGPRLEPLDTPSGLSYEEGVFDRKPSLGM